MENIGANIILILTCWGCAGVFLSIGIYSHKKSTPMHFWSGTTVKSEEVTDIVAYNKENAIMWIIYSLFYWIAGVIGIFSVGIASVIIAISCFPGFIFLVLNYNRIKKKYFTTYQKNN